MGETPLAKYLETDPQHNVQIADGMRIEWDLPIEMNDGTVLRADLFRPICDGRYPIILSMGVYGKGLSFQKGFSTAWNLMVRYFPDTAAGSTNKYQNWEVVDPEKWVPHGYACLRIDSRGSGRSPGHLDLHSPREIRDLHDCIEWAARQDWSNGKVGMNGISYFACNQWYVSKLGPPSLAALCVWEGFADMYREACFSGGIANDFAQNVFDMQMLTAQHGLGERGPRSAVTGELVCGPETLPPEELERNRMSIRAVFENHPFDDDYYHERSADFSKVTAPLLSAGNWGGAPLHTRGNVEGYVAAASKRKWLEMHGCEHWTSFYTDYGVGLQRQFFDHFLKGEDNGWDTRPPILLQIRHPGEHFEQREEQEWPLARTKWTRFYFDPDGKRLSTTEPAHIGRISFEALGEGLTFSTPPLVEAMEITGQSAAHMLVSSSTINADLFLVLRVFDPAEKEVLFRGALDPKTPVAQGWLRASRRKLDPTRSTPYRPYHTHDEDQLLTPDEPVQLDVEIWPTSIVVPKGYRLRLTILGRDFEHSDEPAHLSNMKHPMRGCGPFTHNDPTYRPIEIFGGTTTLHFEEGSRPYVLLPIIPSA